MKGWAVLFGGHVHSSGIGSVIARLKNSLEAPILVERFEPTSQECYACGEGDGLSLSDRVIRCGCGWVCDREFNAALVILRKGLGLGPDQAIGLDRPKLKPQEKEAAARILGSNSYIRVSFSQRKKKPTPLGMGGGHNFYCLLNAFNKMSHTASQ